VPLEGSFVFDRSGVGLGCRDRRDGSGLLFGNGDWGALGRGCCRGSGDGDGAGFEHGSFRDGIPLFCGYAVSERIFWGVRILMYRM
jgi:hypothetical protein